MYQEVIDAAKEKIQKTNAVFQGELRSIRAGRANPQLLDRVMVDYYGVPTPLPQMGNVTSPEPRMLVINIWDQKALPLVEKAILKSDLGLNPSNDGKVIRLIIPELTEERRKDYVKLVRGKGEDARVAVRNIRRRAKDDLDALKSEVGEDDLVRAEKELDAVTRAHVDEIDEALKRKEAELLEV